MSDDLVVCVLRGGFTPVEQTLLESGYGGDVIRQRMVFQDVMRDRFEEVVETATGRKVIGFMSGNQQDPDMICEVFVLEPPLSASALEEEQLELEVGPDVVGGHEPPHAPVRELLDGGDEAPLHGVLEDAARLVHGRLLLELDQGLLDLGVDAAEPADQHVAGQLGAGGRGLAAVVSLVQRDEGVVDRLEHVVAERGALCVGHRYCLSSKPDHMTTPRGSRERTRSGYHRRRAVPPEAQHPDTGTAPGDVRTAISDGLVALIKEYYGRGPDRTKTYVRDDLVVCLLRGGFTRVEQTLFQAGHADDVIRQRMAFQDVMRDRFEEVVEKATGRKVIGFMSGNQQDPDMICEVFVLAPTEILD